MNFQPVVAADENHEPVQQTPKQKNWREHTPLAFNQINKCTKEVVKEIRERREEQVD